MTRGIGLLVLVISLGIVGSLLALQSKSQGPGSKAADQAEAQAIATASTALFQPVDQVLQVDFAQGGTYVGAQLPLGTGVTLVQPTTSSYCLQANVNGTALFERGPGGTPATGHC